MPPPDDMQPEDMQPEDMQPHASWAHLYDLICERTFGHHYDDLTKMTLNSIRALRKAPASLVDFGAGTGRLSIPLARDNYTVTAVEPCTQMLDVLSNKAIAANVAAGNLECVQASMQNFETERKADIAVCVFTVLAYLLDEACLRQGLKRLVESVKPGGVILIDIARREAFQQAPGNIRRHDLHRQVTITPRNDVYHYHDSGQVQVDGQWQQYEDAFQIRYWPNQTISKILEEYGITLMPIAGYHATGADYFSGTLP